MKRNQKRGNGVITGRTSIRKINTETSFKFPKTDFGLTGLKRNLDVPIIAPSKETPPSLLKTTLKSGLYKAS